MNRFYLCSCADDGGIYNLSCSAGNYSELGFYPLPNANYLCYSADGKFLYATFNRDKNGFVAAYKINADSSLTYLNECDADGKSACHLLCSPDNKFLFSTQWGCGSVSVFAIGSDGSIERRLKRIQNSGEEPRAHCVMLSPDGRFICVVDLGIDSVLSFKLDPESGIKDEPEFICKLKAGSGPRHLLFSGDGHFAYVINELGNTLVSFKYDKGRFTEIMSVSTLPEDFEGESYAAAIRFSSDGKYLFTSNRGKDSIACFRALPEGKFELMEIVDSHGKYPRDISFLQDGKHFAAANEHSGRITFFEHESGKLKYLPDWDITKYPRPLCIFNHRPKL